MNNTRWMTLAALLLIAPVGSLLAQQAPPAAPELTVNADAGLGYVNDPSAHRLGNWGGIYDAARLGFAYSSAYLDFGGSIHIANDGKYAPTESWMQKAGNQYFVLDEGYTRLHAGGLAFTGGYLKALSSIETPYDVFLNPLGHSSLGMVLSYEGSFLQYESRWIGVNINSSNPYPAGQPLGGNWVDKGVNYRLIALKLGPLRVGYEESSVYLRTFDANYFLSPLPSFLTNTLLAGTNPWSQNSNDNSLMGLFSDYKSGLLYAEAQLLVDDINLNFLFPPGSPYYSPNVNKLAWSIGGRYAFPFGTIGFWHGGATAHTYSATIQSIPYEYAYYPTVDFPVGSSIPLNPRDSNIGFPWGENALAFKVTFDTDIMSGSPWAFGLSTSLEYVINGSKSPDNPWHQYTLPDQIPQRIQLFNVGGPEVLNNILIFHAGVAKKLGSFEAMLAVDIGADFNPLIVTPAGDGGPVMLAAANGGPLLILDLLLGVRYTFATGSSVEPK